MFNNELPTVWLQVHPLPFSHWYARRRRYRDVTLIWIEPGTLKAEFAFWAQENLTEPERIAIRIAWGESGDLRIPVRDSALDGYLLPDSIPVDLRLPSERQVARSA